MPLAVLGMQTLAVLLLLAIGNHLPDVAHGGKFGRLDRRVSHAVHAVNDIHMVSER